MPRHKREPIEVAPLDSPWLDAKAAALYLHITERQFRDRASRLPGFPEARRKPGLRVLWARKEIDAWLNH